MLKRSFVVIGGVRRAVFRDVTGRFAANLAAKSAPASSSTGTTGTTGSKKPAPAKKVPAKKVPAKKAPAKKSK